VYRRLGGTREAPYKQRIIIFAIEKEIEIISKGQNLLHVRE
jgi:hypothetical protein